MAREKRSNTTEKRKVNLSASTPEGLENLAISLAMDQAVKQLAEGTASSQIIVEFLRRGSTRERLKQEIMQEEKKLMQAKTESLQSQKRMDEMYINAIAAMKKYRGESESEDPNLQ